MDDDPVRHVELPPVTESVPVARHFATDVAHEWQLTGLVGAGGDLALVVSELVTNAIHHGAGRVDLSMHHCGDHSVQVEVTTLITDTRPELRDPSPSAPTGRGLQIVNRLTSAWGHYDRGQRRTVWARFSP